MADPVVHLTNGLPDSGTGNITTLGQTLLDGANVTIGAKADAKSTATDATAITAMSVWKQISASAQAGSTAANQTSELTKLDTLITNSSGPLPAGTAIIGKVGIDQTTDGTTNKVAATLAAETTKVIGTVNVSAAQLITPVDQYGQYETVAASATAQALGATGATGDYLAGVLVFPGTAGCGVVTILDNATTIGTFPGGGTTALPSLVPFLIPVGLFSVSGAWKVTTGANVTAVGIGKFT